MKKKYFIIVIFFLYCGSVQSSEENNLNIECKQIFKAKWTFLVEEYFVCIDWPSSLIVNQPNLEIGEVFHSNGTTIEDLDKIEALDIWFAKAKYLPNGIKKKFPKLKAIRFSSCGLSHLTKKNMRQFGSDLEYASFQNNSIATLDEDLFEFNSNLKIISFRNCPLKFINLKFFEHLKNLKHVDRVYLRDNECIDQDFNSADGVDIKTFVWKFENCSSSVVN